MMTSCICLSLLCIPKLCSFTLELGAVHASSHKNLQQFYSYCCCMVPSVVAHFKKTQAKGNVAGATSGASCGPPTSPPLLCCCSCATLIMCVSALYSQVVQFHLGVGSCACILPQKSTALLLCGPTYSSPLQKNAIGWNCEVYNPNKN